MPDKGREAALVPFSRKPGPGRNGRSSILQRQNLDPRYELEILHVRGHDDVFFSRQRGGEAVGVGQTVAGAKVSRLPGQQLVDSETLSGNPWTWAIVRLAMSRPAPRIMV